MGQIQYIANNLEPQECRKLMASLHFNSFELPNSLQQAENKVPKDVSCLQQLTHWNFELKNKQIVSHDILVRRLKQINRFDLATWLTNSTFERFQRSLDGLEESYRMYEPIFLPYVNYSGTTDVELRITTSESLLRVAKQNPPDPVEDIVVDPTEWTIFDTISWTIVIILFLLVIVLLVYLILASPCNQRKRCQCSPPPATPPCMKKNKPPSIRSTPGSYSHTHNPSRQENKPRGQRHFETHSLKKHHCGNSECPAAYHCECKKCKCDFQNDFKRQTFSESPSYNDVGSYNHYDGTRSPCMVPPAPRPICGCSPSDYNDGRGHHNGLPRTIDIHQKIAIPMNNLDTSN